MLIMDNDTAFLLLYKLLTSSDLLSRVFKTCQKKPRIVQSSSADPELKPVTTRSIAFYRANQLPCNEGSTRVTLHLEIFTQL